MLKHFLATLLLASTVLLTSLTVHSVDIPWRTDHQLTTYWYTTDKRATIAWDANTDYQMGDQFEIKLKWLETNQDYSIATTPNLEYTVQAPRVGHFEVYLRTVRPSVSLYSDWIQSSDPVVATVNNLPKGWIVYWQMAAPGGVIIGLNLNPYKEITNANRYPYSPVEPGKRSRPEGLQPVLPTSYTREANS